MCSEELPQMELEWEDDARRINECEYLYIDSVRELEELTLDLIVTETKVQARILVPRDESPVEQLRLGATPIESCSPRYRGILQNRMAIRTSATPAILKALLMGRETSESSGAAVSSFRTDLMNPNSHWGTVATPAGSTAINRPT